VKLLTQQDQSFAFTIQRKTSRPSSYTRRPKGHSHALPIQQMECIFVQVKEHTSSRRSLSGRSH